MVELPKAISTEVDGNKTIEHYEDGSRGVREGELLTINYKDGSWKRYSFEDGKEPFLLEEPTADGGIRKYFEDGHLLSERYPDGSNRCYDRDDDGSYYLKYETFSDGSRVHYNPDSEVIGEYLPDGSWMMRKNGNVFKQGLPDGTVYTYFENGNLSQHTHPNGDVTKWYVNGAKKYEKKGNTTTEWHLNGKVASETTYNDNGMAISESKFDENGNRTYFKHRDKDGKDDTRMYLAKQKVARKNVEKGAKEGKVARKLNPISKAIQMHKALKEVDAGK